MSSIPANSQIRFPNWVPRAARQRITELKSSPLGNGECRALLARLSTDTAMKTEVWKKLPAEPNDFEGNIIDWTFFAVTIFPRLARPVPKTMAKLTEWVEHRKRYPVLPNPETVSGYAFLLSDVIQGLKTETDLYWDRLWEGDRSIRIDQVLVILDQIRLFYLQMDEENRALLDFLPQVKRWHGGKPAQKFFTDYLSARLKQTYGQPLDSIVAALAQVAFNISKGVDAETVRGRRRIVVITPENSKRKSR
jgi:hypothetical protein